MHSSLVAHSNKNTITLLLALVKHTDCQMVYTWNTNGACMINGMILSEILMPAVQPNNLHFPLP